MDLILYLPILIFSVMLHEVAHGLVALFHGDDTASVQGRLTLNPISHLDLVGSVIFPAVCILLKMPVFGWAKPVPVNPNRFNNYRLGVITVALAGPLTNLLLASIFVGILSLAMHQDWIRMGYDFLPGFLSQAILLNLVLAIFNLFPIPPLDGSRVVSALLPYDLALRYDSLETYGFFIVMGLIAFGVLGKVLYPIVYVCYGWMLGLAGIL